MTYYILMVKYKISEKVQKLKVNLQLSLHLSICNHNYLDLVLGEPKKLNVRITMAKFGNLQ